MEETGAEAGGGAEGSLAADYYYMKALRYLTVSSDGPSDGDSCECLNYPDSEDKEDDHFSLGFRRGLTRDHDDLQSLGSSSCSGGSDGTLPSRRASLLSSASSSSVSSAGMRRERKCSIGGRFYKTGSADFHKPEMKRKLSDGHVHWADEFHKDLARCNPRKSYSRHPSHMASHVKPILKPNNGDCEDQ